MTPFELTKNKIVSLLTEHSNSKESIDIAKVISEKAFEMGHLYSDMGFKSRKEMNDFMSLHFPELAQKRPQEIRWKKFLFDSINEIAPACWQCKDSANCFKCDILEQSA